MKFSLEGPFPIDVATNGKPGRLPRQVDVGATLWKKVAKKCPGIESGRGVYIYSLSYKNGEKPWYVGKTDAKNQDFRKRIAAETCLLNELVNREKSCRELRLWLYVKRTASGTISKAAAHRDEIVWLETRLIEFGKQRNPDLLNTQIAAFVAQIEVPGFFNNAQGAPPANVRKFKRVMGVS